MTGMKIDEIMNAIQSLACSQGFYCRLYGDLIDMKENDPYLWNQAVYELEGQNFQDVLDLVLYFEE